MYIQYGETVNGQTFYTREHCLKPMIQKIKDLMKISEMIDSIGSKIDVQNKKIDDFGNEMFHFKNTFDSKINEVSSRLDCAVTNMETELKDIKELKKELMEELSNFKLQKTRVLQDIATNQESSLKETIERIKTDVNRYNDAKNQLAGITEELNTLRTEFTRLREVSSKIKASDFELTKYASKITAMDKEKLDLMQKVDSLQKLISKERRNKR